MLGIAIEGTVEAVPIIISELAAIAKSPTSFGIGSRLGASDIGLRM